MGLAKQGHKVTLATLWSSEAERAGLDALKPYCAEIYAEHLPRLNSFANCLAAIPTSTPLQASYCWHPRLANQTVTLLRNKNGSGNIDLVHVEHLRGVKYGLNIKARGLSTPVVWDSVDCISYLFKQSAESGPGASKRWLTQFEYQRTVGYEGQLPRKFDHSLVTSQVDKNALISLSHDSPVPSDITVLPNGVDLEYFTPMKNLEKENAALVVSGKMSYHANQAMVLHLVNDIMPLVWKARPDAHVWIVGKDPPKNIRKLAEQPRITVTGTISDIRPYLQRAAVAVAPLVYGAGVQNKILEAMACGTPVVTTPKAVAGLSAVPEQDLLVGRSASEFASCVLDLLEDPARRDRLGAAGRQFVEISHSWESIIHQLSRVYNEVLS
jgi:polysaccharide biosynthesis protein PslH